MEQDREMAAVRGDEGQEDAQWQPAEGGNDGETVTVTYEAGRKMVLAMVGALLMGISLFMIGSGQFVLHLIGVAGCVTVFLFLVEGLSTTAITLAPDRVGKRRIFFGETVIPARRVFMAIDQHTVRFYHGSTVNRRERITIRRAMISSESYGQIVYYAETRYGIQLKAEKTGEGDSETRQGSAAGKGRKVSPLILEQFTAACSSYRFAAATMAVCAVIAVIAVGVADDFSGVAPALPAYWIRIAGILLALGAYPLLKRLDAADGAAAGDSPISPSKLPISQRFKGLATNAFTSAIIVAAVACLGLLLFLLFGNLLDLYLFMAAAVLFYRDFYPGLSAWERLSEGRVEMPAETVQGPLVDPAPARRRSMQVSLVVMGALAVTSFGQSQQYLYKNKKDCMDDWGSEQSCQEPTQGSRYYRTGYYYGPRYGTLNRSGSRAVGAVSVSRGGFGSLGSMHASFGG
jgi:hypothetical protein